MSAGLAVAASVRALRAFVAPRPTTSSCGLCGASMPPHPHHEHLLARREARLVCACAACSLLFDGPDGAAYRRLPRTVAALGEPRLSEAEWQALGVPIRLAFFVRREGAFECVYPSPAGPVKSPVDPEQALVLRGAHPIAVELATDVEALLLCDLGARRAAFRLPIDDCFSLVGLVRRHWRGASGGDAFWSELDAWLAELGAKARGMAHA